MGPLDRQSFDRVIRELDQVAVAATLTGTSFSKIKQLADMVQPMHDALVGDRPEVAKIRKRLRLALHNLRRSPKDQRSANRMRTLLAVLRDLRKLVDQKGIGDAPEVFVVGDFRVLNTWGYSEKELKVLFIMLRRATRVLSSVGLGTGGTVPVFADPEAMKKLRGSSGAYMLYDWGDDLYVANPSGKLSGDFEGVLRAMAGRMWSKDLTTDDHEVWKRAGGFAGFTEAFARKLASGGGDSDTDARLAVTVGRIASRWPSAA